MSRVINTSLATIQFQVNARQANAAMQALQEASDDLNRAIDSVNRNIANLGKDVPKDNPQLLNYQNQLKGLEKDLKDVRKAQRDFLKGAKAAYQLWKAASEGNIESLSFRSIKAGVNGLKKRQEGLSPGDAQDMKDWRIIKEVIDEADRVVKQAGADVQNVVQTIREGGKVSEQTMRQAINTLKELKGSVDETDADFRTYGNDLDFMEAKLQEFSDAQRRAKGEIVDANDARREMNKLTEEGAAAAKREAEEAEQLVASLKQESEELVRKRGEIKQNIEDTQKQIDENHKLMEEKHRQLAADEETFNAEQQSRRESIDGLKTQAEAERKLANEKSDAAETHRRAADLQKQTAEQLTEKVTELQGKLAELNAEPVKPKVDTSGMESELEQVKARIQKLFKDPDMYRASILDIDSDLEIAKKGLQDYEKEMQKQMDIIRRCKEGSEAYWRHMHEWEDADTSRQYYERRIEKLLQLKEAEEKRLELEKKIQEAEQQSTTATNNLTEAQRLYNEAVERRKQKEQELKEIQERSYNDDPEVKRLNEEIAKLEELIAVTDKYKKQFTKMSDKKFEEGYMGDDAEVKKHFRTGLDPTKYIYGAEDYLVSAYRDRFSANFHKLGIRKPGDDGYEKDAAAADRVAKGIVENAQEALRRAILHEIEDGTLSSASMEEMVENFRSKMYQAAREAGEGNLKDDPEYNTYKYIIAQMEKYLEVAKKVEEERAKIAGGGEFLEMARYKDDINAPREGLLRQREKREFQDLTGRGDFKRRQEEAESRKSQEVTQAKNDEKEAERQLNEEKAKSNQQTQEELRLKGELETAQGKLTESKQRENEERQEYVKLQGEAIEQDNKAAAAETKLADAQSDAAQKRVEFNQKQQEGLDNINQMAQGNQALQQSIDGLNGELEQNSKDIADNANKATEAEQKKAQARQLSIKTMEDMLAKLKEEYYTEELTAEKREEHKQKIKELDEALRLAKGEWMSYGDAMKYANSIGSEGFMATDEQTKMATDALTRHREELIKTIQQKEADSQATSAERAELEQLDQALMKVKTGFASADEVMARWAEHMNAGKTASESMAQTLDEKLNAATSRFDDDIKGATERVEYFDKEIEEQAKYVSDIEQELAKLEQKHANSSWLRKKSRRYRDEEEDINELRNMLDAPFVENGNGNFGGSGEKAWLDYLKKQKQETVEYLDWMKQKKAEELGLSDQEVAAEEKKADAQRMTQQQMQEGIKLLEEEYAKTDHTTGEGIKKRQQLRDAIDKMNQELKESTGEWMSVADAMKLAGEAEKNTFLGNDGKGFTASAQDIQKATQALERQRDALLQTIKAKRDSGKATDDEEKELADLTNKLKALKFEQDNFNMSQAKMQELMRTPTNAVSLDELRSAIKRADGELKRMQDSLGKNNTQYKAFAEQVRNAKNQLKEMEGQAKASATAWEKAWSRLKTYVVMYMGFNAVWQKMVGTFSDVLELSDKLGEVRKTTGFTADEVGRLSDNLSKIDTRTPLNELLSLSVAAGQLGLKTQEDVQGFTEAANKLMVALPEMGKEAATEMMKVALATGEVKRIQEQMDEGLVEGSSATAVAIEKIGSTIDRLRASSAAAAPQITDFVKRVGAVGAQSGITIDQVAALGSTVDALGMRVEMSATALSRMIPAIKRNAFEVAKAIGMAPNALRQMFDEAGGGMNAMLAIFQHIKDSGMNANDIEQMLGMGGMADIMKDLNQQGARAGIVFAGLSQNVDVLREHLGIARTAYEENTAIQAEYDRMNETSAAKWERLKNTIEEMFVGDRSQKFFGFIIDGLRYIVDLINGPLQGAFQATIVSVGLIKTGLTGVFGEFGKAWDYLKDSAAAANKALQEAANATGQISEATNGVEEAADVVGDIGEALDGAQEAGEQAGEAVGAATGAIEGMSGAAKVSIFSINGLKTAWKGLDTTMKANIIVMVIALLYTLGKAIYDMVTETTKANKALGEANALIAIAIDRFEGYWAKLKETKTALDEATKSTEGLKEGSEDLAKATGEVVKAKEAHKSAMAEMNGLYGKYLGFMLTEANYANLSAAAHDKVTAAIRREMLAKQQQAAIDNVVQENMEDMKDGLANLSEELREEGRLNNAQAGQAKIAMQNFMRENFTADGDEIQIAEGAYKFLQQKGGNMGKLKKLDANQIAAAWYYEYLKDTFHLDEASLADITGVSPQGGSYRNANVGGRHFRGDYAQAYLDNMQDVADITSVFAGDMGAAEKEDRKSTTGLMKGFQAQIKKAESQINDKSLSEKERNAAYEDLANSLEGLDANIGMLDPKKDKKLIDSIRQQADNLSKTVDANKLTRARNNARSIFQRVTGDVQGDFPIQPLEPEKNPWGSKLEASSTDWKNMTAEQLVNRRKQMKDFVNAIQTDSDVKTVLAEDQALAAAIKKGMASDMRTVIEWYNDQRLKIQDELHARHLTNTGDWMDPKKERGAKKQFRDEMDAYLHELDAYYTERKTRIEEAGTDEGLTEAEIRNRTLNNEMEWQQRRAELQKLYSRKQKEVTQEELDAIYHIISERTGDTESFVKAQIAKTNQFVDSIEKSGEKGAAIVHRWMSQVELDTERSYLKGQQALTKQMRAIEAVIDKERPFNGITKQLQESLSTMDVLTGEMRKEYNELMKQGKDMTDFNNRQAQEEMKRTAFLLGEAENAYSTTIDNVMDDMRQKGMTAWADWLSADPKLQEALMAQLRSTYDAIQDAIKKEASQLKKQAEIMWNNILMPDGKTTLKQTADRAVAQLGLDEGRVKRANSLIGAGQASERVADKLAIQQMKVQLVMQEHYYNLMRKRGQATVDMLEAQAKAAKERGDEEKATSKTLEAQHARMSLNLATSKEETELAKQREDIIARTEESQNRLYTELKSWADLLASSVKDLFEASHAGDAEYYNERAKLDLTGKGGPGAGTYVVIDDAGTSDAEAHYEYLDEREALDRQHEIERENAQAEAWRKVLDDINMKMNDTITDMMNAMLQNSAMDANTQAVIKNTEALAGLTSAVGGQGGTDLSGSGNGLSDVGLSVTPGGGTDTGNPATQGLTPGEVSEWTEALGDNPMMFWQEQSDAATENMLANMDATKKGQQDASKAMAASTQSSFAKMTAAANMYGIAYQAMTNDNLSAEQKFEMMAIQAAGQAAITSLTVDFSAMAGENAINSASVLGKLWSQLGYWAIPVYALFTGLLGGAMGLAVSKIAKSKSEISQATGVSASAGKLTTGMLTYAEGNVNEFTDPSSLTPGRSYNVDGADGKTYRAKYTGKDAKTHITNGPEFHLVGEKGQEAIIDAHTTRLIRMNDTGIWRDIQTLYNGGSLSAVTSRRRGRGIRAFADGNVDEFETMDNDTNETNGTYGFTPEMAASMQASLDRNSEVMEHIAANGIEAFVSPYGPRGVVAGYDKAKKEAVRHGEKFL